MKEESKRILARELFRAETGETIYIETEADNTVQLCLTELDLLSSERSGRSISADTLCRVMNTYF